MYMHSIISSPGVEDTIILKTEVCGGRYLFDLVKGQFLRTWLNPIWIVDTTHIRTKQEWLYWASVGELNWSKFVVWKIDQLKRKWVLKAIKDALISLSIPYSFSLSSFNICFRFKANIIVAPWISMPNKPADWAVLYSREFFNSLFFASILYWFRACSLNSSVSW